MLNCRPTANCCDGRETPVLVAGNAIDDAERSSLESAGCEVLTVNSIADLLTEFGRRRFTNVLVRRRRRGSWFMCDAGFIDEVHAFIAPLLRLGAQGPCEGWAPSRSRRLQSLKTVGSSGSATTSTSTVESTRGTEPAQKRKTRGSLVSSRNSVSLFNG